MTIFKSIYHFNVIDEIGKGNNVFCLDREDQVIDCVNDMEVSEFVKITKKAAQTENNRFEFWIKVNTEEVRE